MLLESGGESKRYIGPDANYDVHVQCDSFKVVLVQCGSEGQVVEEIEVTELSQLLDYSQPHAPGKHIISARSTCTLYELVSGEWISIGALLKAAFICAGIVEVRSTQSLAEQLSKYGSGFELKTVSKVPQGSGELAQGELTLCMHVEEECDGVCGCVYVNCCCPQV